VGDLIQLSHRPKKRGECENGIRPCPFVSCRYHLGHEIVAGMASASDDEIVDRVLAMENTCALDLADEGEQTVTKIGSVMGISRERGRQVFKRACEKIGADPKILLKIDAERMDAACKAYLEGDPLAAAAEYGYEAAALRELAKSRFPEQTAKKRKLRIDRTKEEKVKLVQQAKQYPSLESAGRALGVSPCSLAKWSRGEQLNRRGGKRKGAGRKCST
jgi:hypothetical protein